MFVGEDLTIIKELSVFLSFKFSDKHIDAGAVETGDV
jgi:hypothetical protein